ncbi:MAG: thioredoxin [Oscillospiraceae bacterium]|nr:thioredoxin [Oscillospiraceae bacterium]
MAISHLTAETFDGAIRSGAVIVDFWADWCRPCKLLAPVMDELEAEYGGKVSFAKVDVDACGELAARYEVMSIPTVILFRNGAEIKRFIGAQPKSAYREALASA